MDSSTISQLAKNLGECLGKKKWQITTAESCTGGLVAGALTEIPGSSSWFSQGIVSYSNTAKMHLLGVKSVTLQHYGAVSEEVAREMVLGAQKSADAEVAVSVTGVAGPGGGSDEKPVGMVCFACVIQDEIRSVTAHFTGNRQKIRLQSVKFALEFLLQHI